MKIVAEELVSTARSKSISDEIDLFARSSFNRYYYAAYLMVRETLGQLDEKWRGEGHEGIPDLLKGKVTTIGRRELRSQKNKGLLTDSEYSIKKTSFDKAIEELARLMKEGYQTRVTADYYPEERIETVGKDYKLLTKTTGEARSWVDRAERYSGILLKIWKDLNL